MNNHSQRYPDLSKD